MSGEINRVMIGSMSNDWREREIKGDVIENRGNN